MAETIPSTAPETEDTPETKWHDAWVRFLPTWEEWGGLEEERGGWVSASGEKMPEDFITRCRDRRDAFMLVPAPTISALATKMTVADGADDNHHDLCLADLRMLEWRELVAAYDAAKAEATLLGAIQDEVDRRHYAAMAVDPKGAETEAVTQEALASEKIYEAAVDAQQAAWESILYFPAPTAEAFGIKARMICRERGYLEEGQALDSLLADVKRLLRCGQFPGWKEYQDA